MFRKAAGNERTEGLALITRIVRRLKAWRVYVGRNPQGVSAPAIILLPVFNGVFFCGFAGILAIRSHEPLEDDARSPGRDVLPRLTRIALELKGNGLEAVLEGSVSPGEYLAPEAGDRGPDGQSPAGLEPLVRCLKETRFFQALFFDSDRVHALSRLVADLKAFLADEERLLEDAAGRFRTETLEIVNSRLVSLKDAVWSLEKDVLENVGRIAALAGAGRDVDVAAFRKLHYLNFLLNGLDRLEVRGRDSAGIQISFSLSDPEDWRRIRRELKARNLDEAFRKRSAPGDLIPGSISVFPPDGDTDPAGQAGRTVAFTFKTASIIGELGRNVRDLRQAIAGDEIFQLIVRHPSAAELSMAHTRWASVGSITVENCHPVNNFAPSGSDAGTERTRPRPGRSVGSISVVLNGDIDNYAALRDALEARGETVAAEVTTDTKIIPLEIERYLRAGDDLTEAFRRAVAGFEGSHAIAMTADCAPGKVFLALRGSGQSLYVGLAPDRYLFSSELYGLVEGTPTFLKMEGEAPSRGRGAAMPAGQIVILDRESPGGLAGLRALRYDGAPFPLTEDDLQRAEITTRDIDRGAYPHYFLKEIEESVLSVRKTLLGKYRRTADAKTGPEVRFNLGVDILPQPLRGRLERGELDRIVVIGHGTAAVAGQAVADALARDLKGSRIVVETRLASELSGFSLEDELASALVIPITQSGTTTDTNRAVALARERGAAVIAIVNRRQSDITTKADGVFYTSDGRDIEMSVASTKAFYSQIVAGRVLSLCLAQLLGTLTDAAIDRELAVLERAPEMMRRVLERKDEIRAAVDRLAIRKSSWAVVGSGPNKAAADEVRIKLSELCYKTISTDVVENKKHIDLSAEPLILVCAAGSPEAVMGDIVKDVAIFKAHKATVVVFGDEGDDRFDDTADAVIPIPRAPWPLPVILNTVAGHLWGYFAARRIDADALFLREFRSRLNRQMAQGRREGQALFEMMADRAYRQMVRAFAAGFQERRRAGSFALLSVGTIADLVLLLKYALGKLPLDDFWEDFPGERETASPVDLLDIALGHAVDELSRPIDAIRHQAKTVTVGTSRKELFHRGVIFDLLKELGFSLKGLVSKNIPDMVRIQKAVAAVTGYTLYDIEPLDGEGRPDERSLIRIRQRGGVALNMASRAEGAAALMGTKRTILNTGKIYAGYGKSDGAPLVMIPLWGETRGVRHLLLVHVRFADALSTQEKREILGVRYQDLRNLVNEYNLPWEDRYLEDLPIGVLLDEAVEVVAGQIRARVGPAAGAGKRQTFRQEESL